MLERYVALDMEMTGLNPKTEKILEIGAVKVEAHQITETFQRLVNPHRALTREVVNLTGITEQMAADGVEDVDAVRDFLDFAEGATLVGHHIISDYSFLKQCSVNQGWETGFQAVDTLKLARKFLPPDQKKNLERLCEKMGILREESHRALNDAVAAHQLLECFLEQHGQEETAFWPETLSYRVKKQSPATPRQKKNLMELIKYHKIDLGLEIDSLTRNEISRVTDRIILHHGRIPRDG